MSLRKTRKQIHFHSNQRWAITIIISIILGVLLYGKMTTWNHINTDYDHIEHNSILADLKIESDIKKNAKSKKSTSQLQITPHRFNPNTVTSEELTSMGIKEKDAKSWTKYTSKGGKFWKAEDLKRLYSMNDKLYDQLSPFIDIPKPQKKNYSKYDSSKYSSNWKNTNHSKYEAKDQYALSDSASYNKMKADSESERKAYNSSFKEARNKRSRGIADDFVLSINESDSTELQVLDGVGPVLSSRIVKYREKLGGFHNMNQLLEVYGVKPALVSTIIDRIHFNGPLKKISLNSIEVEELVKHPYFDYSTANIFINYRSHHGDFKNVQDVKKIIIIKDYWLDEAAPYFNYDPPNPVGSN